MVILRPFDMEQSKVYVPSPIEDLSIAKVVEAEAVPSATVMAPAALVPTTIEWSVPFPVNTWVVVFVEM